LVSSTVNHEEIMIVNPSSSLFVRIRQRFFKWRLSREIFDRIFPHLEREQDHGYSFQSDQEMKAQTAALNAEALLKSVERQIHKLPRAYGESFRHIMHRDLCDRLSMYADEAKRQTHPTDIDPRFVATHA
jgi:hypothetical protein